MPLESEVALRKAVTRRRPISLRLSEIGAQRLLEILAESGSSHRVTVEGISTTVTIEIGNGLVVGAKAEHEGGPVGRAAYALLRTTRRGEVHVQPLRFPSLANILEPIEQLPEIEVFSSAPPAPGHETIELALPEARSVTVELDLDDIDGPPMPAPAEARFPIELPSVEIELPPMTAKRRIEPPRLAPAIVPVTPRALDVAPPRRWPYMVAAAAVIGLGLGVAGWANLSTSEEGPLALDAGPTVASTEPGEDAAEPADEAEREAAADEDEGASADERSSDRDEARALARRARRLLRHDHDAAALTAARRAARLRGGMPYYQVLLGDALAANGRRAAARRAYRRALRLHPGYRPAQRRLGQPSSPVASRS